MQKILWIKFILIHFSLRINKRRRVAFGYLLLCSWWILLLKDWLKKTVFHSNFLSCWTLTINWTPMWKYESRWFCVLIFNFDIQVEIRVNRWISCWSSKKQKSCLNKEEFYWFQTSSFICEWIDSTVDSSYKLEIVATVSSDRLWYRMNFRRILLVFEYFGAVRQRICRHSSK